MATIACALTGAARAATARPRINLLSLKCLRIMVLLLPPSTERRIERLVAEGRAALSAEQHAEAADLFRRALALWRGSPLSDFTYERFAHEEITRLEELHVAATEDRLEADLALGRHDELAPELETLVTRHPLRERLRWQLMVALYRAGRQAEALDAYRAARRTMLADL